jgi:hypothetical protein
MTKALLNTDLPAPSDCCAGITKQGKACPWPPVGGSSWCFMHHPEKTEERRQTLSLRGKKGGSTPRAKDKAPASAPVDSSSEIKDSNQQGGARPGAGRKPKALRHAEDIAAAEGLIVAAMPRLIASLVKAAEAGDVAAARYLMDRVWGRVAEQSAPIAEELTPPADHQMAEAWAYNFGFYDKASRWVTAQTEAPAFMGALRELMYAMRDKESWVAYQTKLNQAHAQPKAPNVSQDDQAKIMAALRKLQQDMAAQEDE